MGKSRVTLTKKQRNQIREYAQSNPELTQESCTAWARKTLGLPVGRSTVGRIMKQPLEEVLNPLQKRNRQGKYPEMEKLLYEFVLTHENDAVLSDELLQMKANNFLETLHPGVSVSLAWVQKFKWRHNIKKRNPHGEAGSIDTAILAEERARLQELLDEYDPKDIYNFDETGLFYRMRPTHTLASKQVSGKKKDKTRITIGLCCNMDGSSKEEPVIINSALNPRCFKGHDISKVPIHYYANKKAWMTSAVFCNWLKKFNLKMCAANRNVLLLIDNASSHVPLPFSNVKIHFLPPNTSAVLQPLDAGIIKSFKGHYRRNFLRWLLAQIEADTGVKNLDVLSCIAFVLDAWNEVTDIAIRNCWAYTGIVNAPRMASFKQQNGPHREFQVSELDDLIQQLSLDDPLTAASYISVDEDVETEGPAELENEPEYEESKENDDSDLEEDDYEETSVLSHREAMDAVTKLAVYATLNEIDASKLKSIFDHCRTSLIRSMKQTTIDAFFSNLN